MKYSELKGYSWDALLKLRDELGVMVMVGLSIEGGHNLHIWDKDGQTRLMDRKVELDQEVNPVLFEYAKLMYEAGCVECPDCRKEITIDTGHRYFAGLYCNDCWYGETGQHKNDGGWQKVNANERLD